MRAIHKHGNGGYHLSQANEKPPQTAEQALTRWDSFRPKYKREVIASLLNEQYHLCCYSELRADEEGLGYHIEHVENKSQNPQRTFEYSNLAASALGTPDLSEYNAQGHELFGGHAPGKQQSVDPVRFVSCHQADCHRFFAYVSDGRVVPAQELVPQERERAQYTIDTLNLNSPYLVTQRRKWWDELDALFEEHVVKGWSLADLAAVDLVPVNNRLGRFFSLTRQFWGPAAEQAPLIA
ncbi:retron system putative HNH endonuclease [Pseudoduganella namucuonensis]|uniref:TIGR02646 family protein n=1 Tax=Pseudoduganella namucuonensis TaxID=1035707 RepID=A0A1I7KJN9_9BURK|nr:retron system putative HNH endonuclease [Pseudoduganella namucuonensis]SFU97655.1 TIGR02646 family protein [Pseudoduganella namucuonensis]